MIWFTADLHLGHANIIKHCSRPFSTAAQMDSVILEAINCVVQPGDTLWILGDFAFRGRSPAHYRERIKCRDVRLLLGNHDKRSRCETAGFTSVGDVAEISLGKQRIWMSHYPHRSWPASHKGSWHLYGHVHGSLPKEGNSLDVGVDATDPLGPPAWTPWSMGDLERVLLPKRPRLLACDKQPFWVDPPQGWLYGFPLLYDPAKDGNMIDWMIANGYPEKLARLGLPCTFTAKSDDK